MPAIIFKPSSDYPQERRSSAMVGTAVFLAIILPTLVQSSGEGNLHLLDDEVATAMRSCITIEKERQKRTSEYGYRYKNPSVDSAQQVVNQYAHERRNTSDIKDQLHVLNATDYDYEGYGAGDAGEKLVDTVPRPAMNRSRRSDPLISKPDPDQCLSQCIFANLQVVDARGIPRETELWNRIQSSVTSQQSRGVLRDQLRACFQELQSEVEDDGCSYSNKLERCLMLRFSERKLVAKTGNGGGGETQKTN